MNNRDSDSDENQTDDLAFLTRVAQYLEDGLSKPELAQLELELAESSHKREVFLLVCLGETLTREEYQSVDLHSMAQEDALLLDYGDIPDSPAYALYETMIQPAIQSQWEGEPELVRAPAWSEPRKSTSKRRQFIARGIAAALLISTAIIALLFFRREPPERVASLTRLVNAKWEPGSSLKISDQLVTGQSIVLAAGFAELHFSNHAKMVIEGPVRVTLESRDSIRLAKGKVAVEMVVGNSGFVVHTPGATVTDLGTEFGVSFMPDSNSTDVNVFKGRVNVASQNSPNTPAGVDVVAGDAARIVASGPLNVTHGGVDPQLFVRNLAPARYTLELADLISGGDGLSGLRGGIVDQTTGKSGTIKTTGLGGDLRGDDQYHPASGLSIVDGTFVPGLSGKPVKVDSAGHLFTFRPSSPKGTVQICAGGLLPRLDTGAVINSVLQGVDYASTGHSFLFIHPSAAITFDLDAIRRLRPNTQLDNFHSVIGNPTLDGKKQLSNVYILVNGELRHPELTLATRDTPVVVNIPLSESDRFLTLASISGDSDVVGHQVLLGDPTLSVVP